MSNKTEQKEFYSKDLLAATATWCIEIYISMHVSEMGDKPEWLKMVWSVGQELYLKEIGRIKKIREDGADG